MTNQVSFELQIIRPTDKKTVIVNWIEAQTPTGNFVIGPNHNPLVSVLKERSKIIYKKINTQDPNSFDVYGGIIEVRDNKATILLDL